jgi:hypothetical protein
MPNHETVLDIWLWFIAMASGFVIRAQRNAQAFPSYPLSATIACLPAQKQLTYAVDRTVLKMPGCYLRLKSRQQ